MPIQYLFAYLLLDTAILSGQRTLPRAPLDRKKAHKISTLKRILGRNHKISKLYNSNSKNATRKALHREIREFAPIDDIHNLGPYQPTAHIFHIYIYIYIYIYIFIFEFFKEGSPSAEAVFQGALR